MGNIKYILKRLKSMDTKAMKEKINSIHNKTGKTKFGIFMDMQNVLENMVQDIWTMICLKCII